MRNFAVLASCLASACPADAAPSRVFVAAQGSDGNSCTFAQPCRTFQHAHNVVAVGGEIDVLDPAGYGTLIISKSISIQGHGFSGISAGSGHGITINAGTTDKVNLSGLIIEGTGLGQHGIMLNTAGALTVQNSAVRTFTGHGIAFFPNQSVIGKLTVKDTFIANNGGMGIYAAPLGSGAVTAVFDRVHADNNSDGFFLQTDAGPRGAIFGTATDCIASGNANVGFGVQTIASFGSRSLLVLIGSVTAGNGTGISSFTGLGIGVVVGGTTIAGNKVNGINGGGGAGVSTFGDNRVYGNGGSEDFNGVVSNK